MEGVMQERLKKNKATFAIYRTKSEFLKLMEAFKKLGFNSSKLSFYQPNENGPHDFSQFQKNQVTNGAYVGAILGMLIIGCAYLFIGSGIISVSVTSEGSTFNSMNNLVGGLLAVVFGGLVGAACGTLVGIGTPDPAGKRYGQYLQAGGILVSVESNDSLQADQAKQVFEKNGGHDIHVADEKSTWNMALEESHKKQNGLIEPLVDEALPIKKIGKDVDAQRHPEEQIVPPLG